MTDVEPPVVVRRDRAVGHILLNRPTAMNAVTVAMGAHLHAALEELGRDPEINVIVIRGAGGHFSVGGDFAEVERLRAQGPAALAPLFENFGRACEAVRLLPVPVVAVVEGYAMAGGFELLLAADIGLVRDDAKIADNHANFGLIPGGGSTQRLARLAGQGRALGLILTGERLSGREAVEWGLAYRSFTAADFESGVAAFIDQLAAKSRDAASEIKRLVYDGAELSLADGLSRERRAVIDFVAGDRGAAGITSFTLRKA